MGIFIEHVKYHVYITFFKKKKIIILEEQNVDFRTRIVYFLTGKKLWKGKKENTNIFSPLCHDVR